MRGILADVNVQGQLPYLVRLMENMGLTDILEDLQLRFFTFRDFGLSPRMDDRSLWQFCQLGKFVLLTENRNHDGPDSLTATLLDSWVQGLLPVLTLGNKGKFDNHPEYAVRVAGDIADLLFDFAHGAQRDRARIFIPIR